jgi:hypothetical protein
MLMFMPREAEEKGLARPCSVGNCPYDARPKNAECQRHWEQRQGNRQRSSLRRFVVPVGIYNADPEQFFDTRHALKQGLVPMCPVDGCDQPMADKKTFCTEHWKAHMKSTRLESLRDSK